jgi:hypothetical protein
MQPEPCAPITLTDGNAIGADAADSDLEAHSRRCLPIRGDSEGDRRDRCSRSEEENWMLRITYYSVLFKDPDGIQVGGCCAQSAIEARYFRSVIWFISTSERILDL